MTVRMKHPGLPEAEPATTTQAAYDKVWAQKGWVLVDADPAQGLTFVPEPATAPITPATVRSRVPEKPEG